MFDFDVRKKRRQALTLTLTIPGVRPAFDLRDTFVPLDQVRNKVPSKYLEVYVTIRTSEGGKITSSLRSEPSR